MKQLLNLLNKPCVVGVVADVNQGKSMLLYNLLYKAVQEGKKFNLYYYGLRKDLALGTRIYSVEELEKITNSVVILDEFPSLFNLDDRKQKSSVENTLRLINHNNNIVILCAVPESYKKFLAAKVDYWVFKRSSLADFINGSRAKNVVNAYRGVEKGSTVLNLPVDCALLYDGLHYHKLTVDYLQDFDTKAENVPIFVQENVQEKVEE